MSAVGMGPVQKAAYALLNGNATLTTLGLLGVFDAVPDKQNPPYTTIGDGTEIPFDVFGARGHEDTITIETHVGSEKSTAGFKSGLDIANQIAELLEANPLAIEGHGTSVLCNLEFQETVREDDGVKRKIVQRFRVICQDA